MASKALTPVTDIDPNVWWHLSETRVDNYSKSAFTSMLQVAEDGGIFVYGTGANQYWQFQPLREPGRYALRNSKTQIGKQLSVCLDRREVDDAHTRPCMADPSGEAAQKWDVFDNGNDTLGFVNVANSSRFRLDVRPGTNAYMSSNIDSAVYQPAQHWVLTSQKDVNDGAYSTTFRDTPDSTTLSSAPRATGDLASDSDGERTGLSSGAAAGVGIGAALVVIALFVAGFMLWRRRLRRRPRLGPAPPGPDAGTPADSPEKLSASPYYHYHAAPQHVQHSPGGQHPQEMPHTPVPGELPAVAHFELESR